jgi:glycosyltransferase involved in cell wall biosynthesis
MSRKFRILDVPWHLGHQYEMLKLPFVEWSWLMQYRRAVNPTVRGTLDSRFTWTPYFEAGKYDAAILHLDQDCVIPSELRSGKGMIYRQMDEVIQGIPKIVIMHGTPYLPEMFERAEIVRRVRALVGDNYMVVNSHRAAEEWGYGKVIIHGMSPDEWFDLPKQPRVVTVLSPAGMPSYYDRPFLAAVRAELANRDLTHCHIGSDWGARNWDEYRRFLGGSLLYFNPTYESPMPRARTEAMLSGCCVLTTPHHDAASFIEDGVNGFLVRRNAAEVASLIEALLNDPQRAVAIGRRGRETAIRRFHWERYAAEWRNYLDFVLDDFASRHQTIVRGGFDEPESHAA